VKNSIPTILFSLMLISLVIAYTVLVDDLVTERDQNNLQYLTYQVQEQFFEIEELKTNLSVCNWELGNTQTIELNAYVTRGMIK
jgi:hypothetical protein